MGLFNSTDVQEQCDKAAHILQDFVEKNKIPRDVIANAKGLAIFSAFRAGMYFAGSAGTGVIVARLPDGTWSPPAVFGVRSASFGLVYGVDVYDCVCVLNTQDAVDAYKKPEMKLGGGATFAAGPVGGTARTEGIDVKPVWIYTKSKGAYGGVTLDSTAIKEMPEANADFYGANITTAQILNNQVTAQNDAKKWPRGAETFVEVLTRVDNKADRAD